MKPKFIILGIVLCVLSSPALKADPDDLDLATVGDTYELSPKPVPAPGILTLLAVGVLTLIAREMVRFNREDEGNQRARIEAYWQDLKNKQPSERRMNLQQENR
jgi:hypothetical protein